MKNGRPSLPSRLHFQVAYASKSLTLIAFPSLYFLEKSTQKVIPSSTMALTRSLTLNDITATITIQDGSYPENVDWILKITDTNKNNASTYGAYAIKKTKPVVQETNPDVIPIPNTQSVQIKRINGILKAVEEQSPNTKMVHVKRIAEMLKAVDEQSKKAEKIIYVCILFNYILQDALEFTKSHAKFHKTVVDKCYDMKKEGADCPVLISLANKLLTALSAPLEKPVEPVVQEVKQSSPAVSQRLDAGLVPVVQEAKPVAQEVKPEAASLKPIAQNTFDDVILQRAIKNYGTIGRVWSELTQSQKDKYITWETDDHNDRTKLMKSILTKKGLTFDDSRMMAYYNWEKYYYNPAKPVDRYQKMMEFVKTLGSK